MPPTTVEVQVVQLGYVPITSTFSGRVSAVEVSEVRPQVSGIIDEILFQEGGLVKAGQPLYRINPDNYSSSAAQSEAALNQARANVGTAKASLIAAQASFEQAKADLKRYEGLLEVEAISRQAYDQAITAVKTAGAAVEQAKANLASSEATVRSAEAGLAGSRLDLSRTIVRAPISGRAGISSVTKGALVASGQASSLVTISRADNVYVDISQSSSEILKLREQLSSGVVGQGSSEVQLVLEDGSVYPVTGRLSFANAEVNQNTGAVTIRAVFPNPQGLLLPGMYVNARVNQTVVGNAVALPQTAITLTPKGEAQVYVVGDDKKIAVRSVKTAGTVDGKWVVTEGLKTGDKVVVMGGAKVKPDQQVEVKVANANTGAANMGIARPAQSPMMTQPAPQESQIKTRQDGISGNEKSKPTQATANPNAQPQAENTNQPKQTLEPQKPENGKALSPEEQEMLNSADSSN